MLLELEDEDIVDANYLVFVNKWKDWNLTHQSFLHICICMIYALICSYYHYLKNLLFFAAA